MVFRCDASQYTYCNIYISEWMLPYTKFTSIACLKTEWFDTDDPCLVGDFESFETSTASVAPFKRTRRFRSCPQNCVGKNQMFNLIHRFIYDYK